MSLPINITIYGHQHQVNDTGGNDHNGSKVVILTFGDTHKSQFATAKPMLDWYGFSLVITCTYTNDQNKTHHLGWNHILALQQGGHDISSKIYTHVNKLSSKALNFETASSKKCLTSMLIIVVKVKCVILKDQAQ